MSAFKAYDIRGIYNKDFNKDSVSDQVFPSPHS